jgi:hypothetical protein
LKAERFSRGISWISVVLAGHIQLARKLNDQLPMSIFVNVSRRPSKLTDMAKCGLADNSVAIASHRARRSNDLTVQP